jgi:hypothetical protein
MEDQKLEAFISNLKKHGPGYTSAGRTGGLGFNSKEAKKNKKYDNYTDEDTTTNTFSLPSTISPAKASLLDKYKYGFIKFTSGIVSSRC